jgi:hypothetical protein
MPTYYVNQLLKYLKFKYFSSKMISFIRQRNATSLRKDFTAIEVDSTMQISLSQERPAESWNPWRLISSLFTFPFF